MNPCTLIARVNGTRKPPPKCVNTNKRTSVPPIPSNHQRWHSVSQQHAPFPHPHPSAPPSNITKFYRKFSSIFRTTSRQHTLLTLFLYEMRKVSFFFFSPTLEWLRKGIRYVCVRQGLPACQPYVIHILCLCYYICSRTK